MPSALLAVCVERDASPGEQVVDLPDARRAEPRRARAHRAASPPGGCDREVAAILRPRIAPRLADERPRDHARDVVGRNEHLARDLARRDTAPRAERPLRAPRPERPSPPTCTGSTHPCAGARGPNSSMTAVPLPTTFPITAASRPPRELVDDLGGNPSRIGRETASRDARRRSPSGRSCCPCPPTRDHQAPRAVGGRRRTRRPRAARCCPSPPLRGSAGPSRRRRARRCRACRCRRRRTRRRRAPRRSPTPSSTMIAARRVTPVALEITARQPAAKPGEHLVRTQARRIARDLGHVDALVAVGADQRRDVADRAGNVRHVDHRHVHRDDPDDGRAPSANEHACRGCSARGDIRRRSRSPSVAMRRSPVARHVPP